MNGRPIHSEPTERDGYLFGRGTSDNKGNLMARLQAIEAYRATIGELPVRIRILYEGEEEIGSEHLAAFVHEHAEALQADGCIWEAGYKEGANCAQAKDPPDLCPALSLPTILRSVDARDQAQVNGLLDAVPAYFSQGVIRKDRKVANLAFGIRLQSLEAQKRVVDAIRGRTDPPPGVHASVVGLPVLAAEANAQLSSPWRRMLALLAALCAVFLVLLASRRSLRDAAVPLIPIALASGWSAGLMFVLGLPPEPLRVALNPMSVTLGALVIAISTEFSVLLSARYRQEREAGASPAKAMELTYGSTGAAVLASGVTAIAGFAVLIASDIRMLRDFGILTVVDLSVSLIGVMIVLPAALVWAEDRGALRLVPRPFLRKPADVA